MKKILIHLLVAAMLLTCIVLPLSSCSETAKLLRMKEDERATYFFTLFNQSINTASSSSVEQTISMKIDIGDMAYEQITEGVITIIENEDDLTYLEQSKTTVWVGGDKLVMYDDEGYTDGMMFTYHKDGDAESKLKSPITAEEYIAFREYQTKDDPDMQVGRGVSDTMSCVQNQDKTWTAVYEDFTDEGMAPFLLMLEGIENTVTADHELTDVRLTCKADEDFYPISMSIEFLFEKDPDAETRVPEIRMDSSFKGWNNTVLTEAYDLSGFSEQDDIRTIENFTSALRDREHAAIGSFSVLSKADITYGSNTHSTVFRQEVSYQNRNGFSFDISYTQDGFKIDMSCRDGQMTTTVRDEETGNKVESETEPLPDSEAQLMIQSLIDSENISGVDIVGATVRDEDKGLYRFTLGEAVRQKLEEQYRDSYDAPLDTFRGHIDATMVDGKLLSYTYSVYTTLKIDGNTLIMDIEMTVTFNEVTSDGMTF